jgi:hypothetical protein
MISSVSEIDVSGYFSKIAHFDIYYSVKPEF